MCVFTSRLDYGFSTTDRLYDYVSARAYGEHEVRNIFLEVVFVRMHI